MTKEKYVTCRVLAKQAGISIVELKKLLQRRKYLFVDEPTQKALRSSLAMKRDADSGSPYFNPDKPYYYVWNDKRVLRVIRNAGRATDPRNYTRSDFNAGDNLVQIGRELARHFGWREGQSEYGASEFLLNNVGPDAHAIVDEMDHGAALSVAKMRQVSCPEDLLFLREAHGPLFERAARFEEFGTKHLDAARSILVGIEDFLRRQIR